MAQKRDPSTGSGQALGHPVFWAKRFFKLLRSSRMHRFSFAVAVLTGLVFAGLCASAQVRLELDRKGETIVLEPYAPNILRVTLSLTKEPALAAPGYAIIRT